MWIPTKNWNARDYFNVEDYNRIKHNLLELRNLAIEMYPDFDILPMGNDKVYQDYSFYTDEMNLLEANLAKIRDNLPYWSGDTKTWYDNQPFLTYVDLNRIEGGMKQMYDNLTGQSKGRARLAFVLGRGRCAVCP